MSDIPLGALMAYAGPVFYRRITEFEDVSVHVSKDAFELGIANAEHLASKGWLLADGGRYSPFDSRVSRLNDFLQFGWGGQGAPATYFRVPDLQGVFVRGVANGANPRDPDALARRPIYPGGNRGYDVGSFQEDAIQSHQHSRKYHESNSTGDRPHRNFEYQDDNGNTSFQTTAIEGARTSTETRPKNVYVHWIVKASDEPIDLNSLVVERIELTKP